MTKTPHILDDPNMARCPECDKPMIRTNAPEDGPRQADHVYICLECRSFRYEPYSDESYELPDDVTLKVEFPDDKGRKAN